MTKGTLKKLIELAKNLPDSTKIVSHDSYLHGSHGIYDLPKQTSIIYICCAMGGCSWRHTPAEYYKPAIFWDGTD